MNARAQLPEHGDDDAVAALRELLRQRRIAAEQPESAAAPAPSRGRPEPPGNTPVPGAGTARQAATKPPAQPQVASAEGHWEDTRRNRWLSATLTPQQAPEVAPQPAPTARSWPERLAHLQLRRWQVACMSLLMVLALAAQLYTPAELRGFAQRAGERAQLAYAGVTGYINESWASLTTEETRPDPVGEQRSEVLALRAENTALRDRLELIEAQLTENAVSAAAPSDE